MILLYHHVSPLEEIPSEPGRFIEEGWTWTVAPETLDAQLIHLRQRGYRFVSLTEYVNCLSRPDRPPKIAAVTFDDGWRDNHRHALPVLATHAVPATFFLISQAPSGTSEDCFLDEAAVGDLLGAGMEIGAHTRTHRPLPSLTDAELYEETAGCRRDLEERFGCPVSHFAYPGGNFNRRVSEVVSQTAGFASASSVMSGGINTESARYWLYRETLGERWRRWPFVSATSGPCRLLRRFRSNRQLRRRLSDA